MAENELIIIKDLAEKLVQQGLACSETEATVVAQAVLQDHDPVQAMQEYLDLTRHECQSMLKDYYQQEHHGSSTNTPISTLGTDTELCIGPGECELCERYIQLTRHHLIPKSTWTRIEPRFRNAWANPPAAARFIGDENVELLQYIQDDADIRPIIMARTCDICRPCHNYIHRTHDNMTLALQYNTIDKLLSDPTVRKFCQWANKQRAGKYAR